MSRRGDILARLAEGVELTRSEINTLRFEGNNLHNMGSRVSSLLTPSGTLDPNIFSHHSGEFSVLPRQASGMAVNEEFEGQEIPDITNTQIKPFESSSQLPTRYQIMDYEYGIRRDLTLGEFIIPGNRDALYLFHGFTTLTGAVITSGHLFVREKTNETGFYLADGGSSANDMVGCAVVQGRPSESRWQLDIYQTSDATRNLYTAYWSVTRLR